jgi:hypothetical protein
VGSPVAAATGAFSFADQGRRTDVRTPGAGPSSFATTGNLERCPWSA